MGVGKRNLKNRFAFLSLCAFYAKLGGCGGWQATKGGFDNRMRGDGLWRLFWCYLQWKIKLSLNGNADFFTDAEKDMPFQPQFAGFYVEG
ncbi:hypothetical protein D3C81_2110820 [compost metagenome]